MPNAIFHPAVARWFAGAFPEPTPAQSAAWPAIAAGGHALIAAPTGSGKTLAAFLAAIDALVRRGLDAPLANETAVVYVSPLKALSNDIRINLDTPLAGIRGELEALGLPEVEIRTAVRTGDTPSGERTRMARKPPHILVTTPESLYVLLGSESGRRMLATARSVIVDEIHAIAPSKRGSHLSLTLERLDALAGRPLQRIGLSATQKPVEEVARFLVGAKNVDAGGTPRCTIIDAGHVRARDLGIEVPPLPLEAVMSNEAWQQVYDRLGGLALEHRTTLVFVNTRRLAERAARHLSERLGKDRVAAHHGSLAKEQRLDAEQRLKRGDLRVLVATASLELGIDIGDVELVCQIGSPRAISAFLQRVGRSGHAVGGLPKGRLFPQSRDDLVECTAQLDAIRRGELDRLHLFEQPLDVLAQQIAAEVGSRDVAEDELYALVTSAYSFRSLDRRTFDEVVESLSQGYTTKRGPRAALVHRDGVNGMLHGRRGTRMTAVTSGGAIPDTADYEVVLEPGAQTVGSVNEDFAVESLAGDVFQLGNASYRVLRIERGRVRVEDAQGASPSIPFWLGEAPGRTDELSHAVSRLRQTVADLAAHGRADAERWLVDEIGLEPDAAQQLTDYIDRTRAALGAMPTRGHVVIERFFDESGGTQLILHAPFGSRINRAWGLALRKRFCRKFNFELQAAATEDAIILSLSLAHSFALIDVIRYLHSATVRDVLVQALLDAPMFGVRWRWNATTALALPRFAGGKRVAPQLQRMKSEDLLATVFPDQVACAENLTGEREIPDHPLVRQTIADCLHDAMDLDGLVDVLKRIESGQIAVTAIDLAKPSPLAAEVLSARPYAFLDDAPLEERRTQAVLARRWSEPTDGADMGRLDPEAIAGVREEAWPDARTPDELHEAINGLGGVTDAELRANGWSALAARLCDAGRLTRLSRREDPSPDDVWTTAERLATWRALLPGLVEVPLLEIPAAFAREPSAEEALTELVRSRLTGLGPTQAGVLATFFRGVEPSRIDATLAALEVEGYVMRGRYSPGASVDEWCERHLLARIHRYTVKRLRREIEPVEPRDFLRFLAEWQHAAPSSRVSGPEALAGVLSQLEGFPIAAGLWESQVLPSRVENFDIAWLDELSIAGRVVWARLAAKAGGRTPVKATPIVIVPRRQLALWSSLVPESNGQGGLSSRAEAVREHLALRGASFFDEMIDDVRLLRVELEQALAELVSAGLANADSFAGLRALLVPNEKRTSAIARRGRRRALFGVENAGRWSLLRRPDALPPADAVEHVARTLLRRYGVVSWRMIEREGDFLPSWRELLRVYHRLEARGEIRGGRFIAGVSGEQFALPEALVALREARKRPHDGAFVAVSGADPLNLAGTILPAARVPASVGTRLVMRDGLVVATLVGGVVEMRDETLSEPDRHVVAALLHGREPNLALVGA